MKYKYNLLFILFFIISISNTYKGQTNDSVYNYLVEIGIKCPDIVLKQAILETGHFKSYSSRVRHNLFGLTRQHKLECFDSWKQSCNKYKLWVNYKYDQHHEDYYSFLVRIGYATDPEYINKLKAIKL